jgi:hypothetical protein
MQNLISRFDNDLAVGISLREKLSATLSPHLPALTENFVGL